MKTQISKYINYAEATKSQTAVRYGVDNTPDDITLQRMKKVAAEVFDVIREHFGVPIGVSSFYRSKELNEKIGGSKNSQHVTGEAIDIDADIFQKGVSNSDIFNFVKDNLTYDQLIWEYGDENEPDWVHVSLAFKGFNRLQRLKAIVDKETNKTKYIKI